MMAPRSPPPPCFHCSFSFPSSSIAVFLFLAVLLLSICRSTSADDQQQQQQQELLVPGFYHSTCPQLQDIVQAGVEKAVENETRMAASLLRLHFHDCFVNGCDGSVLLDDTPTFTGEKNAVPNKNSIRGFEVIDQIKARVESECPGLVSCADIIAIAARDSVVLAGGPSWEVLLGRRDSLTASQAAANASIPSPALDVPALTKSFQNVGLTLQDMITLSGSHTIGQAHCFTFTQRLYNQSGNFQADPSMDSQFLLALKQLCPQGNPNPNTLASLDLSDPTVFNNHYFDNLMRGEGLLNSDQVLFTTTGITQEFVELFSKDQHAFFANFAISMVKMGNIKPLTGSEGEIRRDCRVVNPNHDISPSSPVPVPPETALPPPPPPPQDTGDLAAPPPPQFPEDPSFQFPPFPPFPF
ncbi:peroxidase P7 [Selaginella moellendorffii]|uniref:peroxidase P7 n=1 Tax=Selaginella moellendorffii TaxID=88036 RepID=UPI000D1D0518|nr:peroxidase P7 [Selaginella moellendorffii]|eukprot:XP_024523223.1 peroxidase P7 [Selaginella moellendorffii]